MTPHHQKHCCSGSASSLGASFCLQKCLRGFDYFAVNAPVLSAISFSISSALTFRRTRNTGAKPRHPTAQSPYFIGTFCIPAAETHSSFGI